MSESSAASALTVSYSATFPSLYALFNRCFPFQRHSIILSRSLPVAKVSAFNHQSHWLTCHVPFRKTLSLLTPGHNVSIVRTQFVSHRKHSLRHKKKQLNSVQGNECSLWESYGTHKHMHYTNLTPWNSKQTDLILTSLFISCLLPYRPEVTASAWSNYWHSA